MAEAASHSPVKRTSRRLPPGFERVKAKEHLRPPVQLQGETEPQGRGFLPPPEPYTPGHSTPSPKESSPWRVQEPKPKLSLCPEGVSLPLGNSAPPTLSLRVC